MANRESGSVCFCVCVRLYLAQHLQEHGVALDVVELSEPVAADQCDAERARLVTQGRRAFGLFLPVTVALFVVVVVVVVVHALLANEALYGHVGAVAVAVAVAISDRNVGIACA